MTDTQVTHSLGHSLVKQPDSIKMADKKQTPKGKECKGNYSESKRDGRPRGRLCRISDGIGEGF